MKKWLCLLALVAVSAAYGADKKIVFLAGLPSHGPGEHEHRAGCLLLQSCLDHVAGVSTVVYSNGWPQEASAAFDGAATVVVYSDGEARQPVLQPEHVQTIRRLMDQGVGLVCMHYAVEPGKEPGEKELLQWLGGCFERNWSVNPVWTADYKALPTHPVARGVEPFTLKDEWYFHMRFPEGMNGVTPVLTAVPPESTMSRPDGAHEGNPAVRAAVKRGEPQHMAWVFERPDGGRGFGFTGGHYHQNWGNDNVRKLVLNAILWTAHVEVPAGGVSSHITAEDLQKNLDAKGR